jgi:glycosyltransferase involved in cell wall biosynthesis
VLFLIPSLEGGGAERTLLNILNKFDYETYSVTLVVVCFTGVYVDQIPKSVKIIPIFKSVYVTRILSVLQKRINFTYIFRLKIQRLCKEKYHTAISFLDSNFTELLFFIPKVDRRVTWVHSSYKSNRNFYKFYKKQSYRNKLIEDRYSKLDEIVFVSEDSKNEFIEVFGEFSKMSVVYNLLNESEVRKKSCEFDVKKNNDSFLFIAVGSLFPVKGYEKLINAANLLRNKNYNFEIHIYGKGFLKAALNERINQFKIQDFVKLKGFVKNPYPFMKVADVFLMSSISEAMPMALCEAMLLDVPTLVTNCSGCREVVGQGRYGVMVDQTAEAIASGMTQLMDDSKTLDYYKKQSQLRANVFKDEAILKSLYRIIN